MILGDLIKENLLERIESELDELEHDIEFINISGNKWQAVMSFDLDDTEMCDEQKALLSALLKHL